MLTKSIAYTQPKTAVLKSVMWSAGESWNVKLACGSDEAREWGPALRSKLEPSAAYFRDGVKVAEQFRVSVGAGVLGDKRIERLKR